MMCTVLSDFALYYFLMKNPCCIVRHSSLQSSNMFMTSLNASPQGAMAVALAKVYIDGSVQDCSNFSVSAMELMQSHYCDVIMGTVASQITSLTIVYSTVYSGADQRKHQAPRHWPLCEEFTGDR